MTCPLKSRRVVAGHHMLRMLFDTTAINTAYTDGRALLHALNQKKNSKKSPRYVHITGTLHFKPSFLYC